MNFDIIHKPTFTNQLLAIPKDRAIQIIDKIRILQETPQPHEPQRKKLHGYKGDIYRLRSGDYRVIYTYGDGWVALLGVDDRKDVYRGGKLVTEEPTVDIHTTLTLTQRSSRTPLCRRRPRRFVATTQRICPHVSMTSYSLACISPRNFGQHCTCVKRWRT